MSVGFLEQVPSRLKFKAEAIANVCPELEFAPDLALRCKDGDPAQQDPVLNASYLRSMPQSRLQHIAKQSKALV